MARGRLTQALDEGAVFLPPEGEIALIGADGDFDLGPIDGGRVRVTSTFRPDHDVWASRGVAVGPDTPPAQAAIVVLPRSRMLAKQRIVDAVGAVPAGAPVLVDGQKDNGIDGLLKRLRGLVDLTPAFSKAHGKIAQFPATPLPDDWRATPERVGEFVTAPGAFSADGIDPGSAALVAALPTLGGRVADLGAGWGYLSAMALKNEAITSLDLIEADFDALGAARANIDDPRAAFHWADATRFRSANLFDVILANPPFHNSRRADPALGQAFIRAAAPLLAPRGTFYMVANRHLPYESVLGQVFGEVSELPGPAAFKLIAARKPRKSA